MLAAETGWIAGYVIGGVVVLAVVALVLPILVLAHRIGGQATAIDAALAESVTHTAALGDLTTTIDAAERITAGLARGRARLGG